MQRVQRVLCLLRDNNNNVKYFCIFAFMLSYTAIVNLDFETAKLQARCMDRLQQGTGCDYDPLLTTDVNYNELYLCMYGR